MAELSRSARGFRFGAFELDSNSGNLRKHGIRIRLQDQPRQILTLLLHVPGEIVPREAIRQKLWPADDHTFVDFENSLNAAVGKLRQALEDSAEKPRFIETCPRKGYRFIAKVEPIGEEVEAPAAVGVASKGYGAVEIFGAGPSTAVSARQEEPAVAQPLRRGTPFRRWPWIATIAGIAIVLNVWVLSRRQPVAPDQPMLFFDLDVGGEANELAIAPDGLRVVFASKSQLAVRRLDQAKVTLLAGTQNARFPFFSPDGQWIAYFADSKLKKIALEGGSPVILCEAPLGKGGSWGEDGQIVASLSYSGGLSRVPASGGTPQPLTTVGQPPGVVSHRWPALLPDGKGVLFGTYNGGLQSSLRVLPPHGAGPVKTLVENSSQGRYVKGGYLVYHQGSTLFAAPIDLKRLELTGSATPLVAEVAYNPNYGSAFDVSTTGTLVYRRGKAAGANNTVVWLDSSGKTKSIVAKAGGYWTPRLSPDGKRLAFTADQHGSQRNLWIYDLVRETMTRLTFDAEYQVNPVWTPDGEFVVFKSGTTLGWVRSDGSGEVQRLPAGKGTRWPWSISPDGKWLAFYQDDPETGPDLWTAPLERTPGVLRLGRPEVLLRQAGSQLAPAISPDGRWVAYVSNESGRSEIYVIPFSPGGPRQSLSPTAKSQISSEGGFWPVWSRNSHNLFYKSHDNRVMAVAYTSVGGSFAAAKPRVWADKPLGDPGVTPPFDAAPDGKRVVVLADVEESKPETHLRVLLHVGDELRRRAAQTTK